MGSGTCETGWICADRYLLSAPHASEVRIALVSVFAFVSESKSIVSMLKKQ
jgi:hypothetical protein